MGYCFEKILLLGFLATSSKMESFWAEFAMVMAMVLLQKNLFLSLWMICPTRFSAVRETFWCKMEI